MSAQRHVPFNWMLWIQWVAVTTLGWLLVAALYLSITLVGVGLSVGILQWVILRQHISHAGRWIPASTVGWAVGWLVAVVAIPPESRVLVGASLGTALGIAQWLILRRQLYQAGWWIVVSTLAWSLGLAGIMGELLVGAVVGAVTGIALELLLRYPSLMKSH